MKQKILFLIFFNMAFIGGIGIGKTLIKYDRYKNNEQLKSLREPVQNINLNAQKVLSNCSYGKQNELFISLYRSFKLNLISEIIVKLRYIRVIDSLATVCLINSIGNVIVILILFSESKNITSI
jgi:hypothetical protein